ncbi:MULTISPECIES: oligosaccharide flippase family protein [unclassified Providencia]|uniref:oligosaccharide flippase family protein n=1 Tax=unclassified Providencia TaxID=2633465 RepID=UPI002349E31F|nr:MULTISPECIES: oligosaccharide flippase family protein [unclassified Providencia]
MSLAKNTIIYLISNILNAAIPFILLPILTRYLTPSEYGQIAIFQVLLSALTTFIGLNTIGSANRKFYDNDVSSNILKSFNGSCFQILLFSTIATLLFILLFGNNISKFLSIPIDWVISAILISALTFIATLRLGQWQIRGEAKYFGILQISNSLMNMLLSVLLVIFMKQGASGRIDAQLIVAFIIAIISLLLLYKDNLLKIFVWQPKQLKEALAFGVPLIPHHVGFFLLSSIDRFFINEKLGLAEAGIYMVAVQLSMALVIIYDAINKAFVPWLFEKLKKNSNADKIKIVKLTYLHFIFSLLISLLAFIIGPTIVIFIAGEEYIEAARIIGILCLGQCFGGMYMMVTNYIFFSKKTGKLSLITILSGAINVILLVVLLKNFGLTGVAISFLISKFIQFVLTWVLSSRCIIMPWFSFRKSNI